MYIPSSWLDHHTANTLALRPERMLELMGLAEEGEGYGVSDCTDGFNLCMRREIVETIASCQSIYEHALGYPLTPRYKAETHLWSARNRMVQTGMPWVDALALEAHEVVTAGAALDWFIVEAVQPVLAEAGTYYELRVADAAIARVNPAQITLFNAETMRAIGQYLTGGAGATLDEDTDEWVWRLNTGYGGGTVHLFSPAMVTLTVPAWAHDLDELVICYPGETLEVYERTRWQDEATGDVTVQFNAYNLLDPRFYETDYWSLPDEWSMRLRTVDVVRKYAVEQAPELVAYSPVCEGTEPVTLTVAAWGTLRYADAGTVEVRQRETADWAPSQVRLWYRVNPRLREYGDFDRHEDALAQFVASRLKFPACGCTATEMSVAYIEAAQLRLQSHYWQDRGFYYQRVENIPDEDFGRTAGGAYAYAVAMNARKAPPRRFSSLVL